MTFMAHFISTFTTQNLEELYSNKGMIGQIMSQ